VKFDANRAIADTGAVLIDGQTDVFRSVDDARWDYARLVTRTATFATPVPIGPLGDEGSATVDTRTRGDGAKGPNYGVIFRIGNVTEVIEVLYLGEPGSRDLAYHLSQASARRITAPSLPYGP